MAVIQEIVPEALSDEAEAARSWFAHQQSAEFKLTAIVDPQDVVARHADTGARELQLILCGQRAGQEVCLRDRAAAVRAAVVLGRQTRVAPWPSGSTATCIRMAARRSAS